MIVETDHDFHMRRARAELDLAYRSECRAATESHLRLSSLHMQRLRNPRSPGRARVQSLFSTPARVFSPRSPERTIEAREVEAVSG
ncbi:MAG: hypothetical protein ACXW27_16115 [Allosphingosinicella sp.]